MTTSDGPFLPEQPSQFRRRLAVIMAADVAGYSRLLATGEEQALALFNQCRAILDAEVTRYGGRIFNTAGDSVMSEFVSAVEAVRAAMAIQHALDAVNQSVSVERKVLFRIGVHVGDVVDSGGDLLGDGVNIAARLEGASRPGGVCISRGVHDAVAGKVAADFRPLGALSLKNIPTPVEAYCIILSEGDRGVCDAPVVDAQAAATPMPTSAARRGQRHRKRLYRLAMITLAITIAIPTVRFARQQLETQLGMRLGKPAAERATQSVEPPPSPGGEQRAETGSQSTPDAAAAARTLLHRGRQAEAAGDANAARQAYADAALLGAGYIEPASSLAALVGAREGASAARDAIASLAARVKDSAVRMVLAQQAPAAERANRLRRMLEEDKAFFPAWFAYGLALGDVGAVPPTIARLQAEKAAFEQFLAAARPDAARRYFLDDATLQDWSRRATRRVRDIEASLNGRELRPTLSYTLTPAHITVQVRLPEDASSVQYRLGDKGRFSRADLSLSNGAGAARSASFALPAKAGKTSIQITYTDQGGMQAGPFAFPFDAAEVVGARERGVLTATSGSWVTWAADRDELFFPYLLGYRCVIDTALVGFDGAEPDIALPLPRDGCDQGLPPPAGAQSSIPAPHDARSVLVRLTLDNGVSPPGVSLSRDQ